jgi:dTDP-4-dehydrorhamnose reductase
VVATIKGEIKWLILGGDGQLGKALGKELEFNNDRFFSLNRQQVDIRKSESVLQAFEEYNPDVVVNVAAWTNVDAAETHESEARIINALGPQNIAYACAKSRVKFVHLSSDYVFSGKFQRPWPEYAATCPVSAYGRTKAEGELLVLSGYPTGSFVVRTAWLYSEWGINFAKTMVRRAIKEVDPIQVVTDQVGQPTSASHLAAQIRMLVVSDAKPGLYHGTNSGQTTWYEFAKRIFQQVGADESRLKPIISDALIRPAQRPRYSVLGHQQWMHTGISPMCDWTEALHEVLPGIVKSVSLEEQAE